MRSKSLVKDLVCEEPFGYRSVHHSVFTLSKQSNAFYKVWSAKVGQHL